MGIPRREFLRQLTAATTVAFVPSALLQLFGSPSQSPRVPCRRFLIRLSEYPALQAIEGSVKISVPNPDGSIYLRLIVTRIAADSFAAVDDICTHAGCLVGTYRKDLRALPCPCHGALFRPTGEVISGPASRPLQRFPTFYTPGSDVLEVELPAPSSLPYFPSVSLAVLSNPATDWLEILVTAPAPGPLRFRIFTLQGHQVLEWQQELPKDQPLRIRYPLTHFAPGSYWLQVSIPGQGSSVQRFIILR